MRNMIKDAKHNKHIFWSFISDSANAYGFLDHKTMFYALDLQGIPDK